MAIQANEGGGRRTGRGTRPPRVLIVEDEPAALEALQALFEYEQYVVATAADGNEALRTFDRFHPDVVVMDWRLPGPWGGELHDEIQARSESDVPVVIVSSADEAFAPEQTRGVARLRKPLDFGRLRKVVAASLTNH